MRARLKVSRAGIDLIARFEGLRRRAARLPDGRWTIGYGHTLSAREGAEVSDEDARALLHFDLLPIAEAVNSLALTPLNQNQFDALVAFAWNVGVDQFRSSDVLRRVNEGRLTEAACAFDLWRKADLGGDPIILDALIRRRAAEKALFLTPVDGFVPTPSSLIRPMVDETLAPALPQSRPAEIEVSMEGDQAEVLVSPLPEPEPSAEEVEVTTSEAEGDAPQESEPVEASYSDAIPVETPAELEIQALEASEPGAESIVEAAPEPAPVEAPTFAYALEPIEAEPAAPAEVIEAAPAEAAPEAVAQSESVTEPAPAEPAAAQQATIEPAAEPEPAPEAVAEAETQPVVEAAPEPAPEPEPAFPAVEPAPAVEPVQPLEPEAPFPAAEAAQAAEPVEPSPPAYPRPRTPTWTALPLAPAGKRIYAPTPPPQPQAEPVADLQTSSPVPTSPPPPVTVSLPAPAGPAVTAATEAPASVWTLTPPPEAEPTVEEEVPPPAPVYEIDERQTPLFEDRTVDEQAALGRVIRHEELVAEDVSPDRPSMGPFVLLGAIGLAAFGGAVSAFIKARAGSSGLDELTVIAWILALIGAGCVGTAVYFLLKRLGGVED